VSEPTAVRRGVRIGVDVGQARVGVAASDPDGVLATPVATLAAASTPQGGPDVSALAALVAQCGGTEVLVGLPRSLNGAEGPAARGVRSYASALAAAVAPVPVRLVDERWTTVDAHRALHAAGRPGRSHRAVVDQVAAVLLLQAGLDAERASGRPAGELVAAVAS